MADDPRCIPSFPVSQNGHEFRRNVIPLHKVISLRTTEGSIYYVKKINVVFKVNLRS